MIKSLFSGDLNRVVLLGTANLSLVSFRYWAENLQPIFQALVPLGQVAVAIVTVIYIWRKAHLLKSARETKDAQLVRKAHKASKASKARKADAKLKTPTSRRAD